MRHCIAEAKPPLDGMGLKFISFQVVKWTPLFPILVAIILPFFPAAAADSPGQSLAEIKSAVITNYANMMSAGYADSYALVRQFQTNIETLLQQPTAEHLKAAQASWIASRQPYSQTEVARFYDGPIGPVENHVNGWPIDPNYLDYTAGSPDAGMINKVGDFPEITFEVVMGADESHAEHEDENQGEKNSSTGFHAIEFLLWGQDLYADGPGRRTFTDFLDGPTGPSRHAARRREYLNFLTQMLVNDLQGVALQWSPGQVNNYRTRFLALPADVALTKIFTGVGNLSSSELMNERMLVPYTTKNQENEQCCFSDTTHWDLIRDELGVQNVFTGRYQRSDGSTLQGPGLLAILEKANPKLAGPLRGQVAGALAAIQAIPQPFDQAILGDDSAPGRVAIKKALAALQAQNGSIIKATAVLGISLNLK